MSEQTRHGAADPLDLERLEQAAKMPKRIRTISLLRSTLQSLCDYVWAGKPQPGIHYWSIPVDEERDFDCIISDSFDELACLRREVRALREQVKGLEADREGWSAATFHQADAAQRFAKQLSAIRKALADMPTMDDPEHMIAFIDAVEEALSPSSDAKEPA